MRKEPERKRAVVFVDGQNLFHGARAAFDIREPAFDVLALGRLVCEPRGWDLAASYFYTGLPDRSRNPKWHDFWQRRLLEMQRLGIRVYYRSLRYRNRSVQLADGKMVQVLAGEEKGIDVRIALDMVRLFHQEEYEVAVLFSRDQDLREATDEIRTAAKRQDRWVKLVCAFPDGGPRVRGIDGTDWVRIGEGDYRSCLLPGL